MNATELQSLKDGSGTGVWCCKQCGIVYASNQYRKLSQEELQAEAEKCCRVPVCKTCSQEFERRYPAEDMCSKCKDEAYRRKEERQLLERLEKAVDVTDSYDGPVYCEEYNGCSDMGEGYYIDINSLHDALAGDVADSEWPEWAFACKSRKNLLDLDYAIERLCEDGYEDMADYLVIPASLEAAVKEFNESNDGALTVWEVDCSRKIRIPREQAE